MSELGPHARPSQYLPEAPHDAVTESQASGPQTATLASELTVYTTEHVVGTYGTGVQDIVLQAFGSGLEQAGAAYILGSVATKRFPVPEGTTSTAECLDAFEDFLPTARTSTRCNLLVVDEGIYNGPSQSRRGDGTSTLGGLAVSRGAGAISRDLTVDTERYGRSRGDYWLNRCLLAAATVYGVSPDQGRTYRDADGDGPIVTPAATDDSEQVERYDHMFADAAAETLQRTV